MSAAARPTPGLGGAFALSILLHAAVVVPFVVWKAAPDAALPPSFAPSADPFLARSSFAALPLAGGSGLPYDSTPVLVSGGRAISIVNQDGAIPNYHWPSDSFSEISKSAPFVL